jgi:hypothetical protein
LVVHIDGIICQVDEEGQKAVLNIELFQRLLENRTALVPLEQVSAIEEK